MIGRIENNGKRKMRASNKRERERRRDNEYRVENGAMIIAEAVSSLRCLRYNKASRRSFVVRPGRAGRAARVGKETGGK